MPIPLTPSQESLISAIAGSVLGSTSTILIEWYRKKRNPKEVEVELSEKINQAATDNVITAQSVIDILDKRLSSDRSYYEGLIERGKQDCQNQISAMNTLIEELQEKITKGKVENIELNRQVGNLTKDKDRLQQEVTELKNRLRKYEKDLITINQNAQ